MGIALATVVAMALGYLHFYPPGRTQIVTFYTNDASSIETGDGVRMAGIPVGEVDEVFLEPDRVRVRARLDNAALVGDQSQVQIRMLTVVGGYYVNINSIGDRPLGGGSIPAERVSLPYSLVDALNSTTKITEKLDAKPIEESLTEIQKGLTGTNVEAIAAIVDAGNSIMSAVDRQRGQVTSILDVSDEYIDAFTQYRGELVQLIRKVSIAIQTFELYGKGLTNIIEGLGGVLLALKPVSEFYEVHRVQFIEKVREYTHKTRLFVERNGLTVRFLQRVQNLFARVLDAQNADPGLLATDLCIPTPGSPC